jgi:hypothetical protein
LQNKEINTFSKKSLSEKQKWKNLSASRPGL